MADRRPASPQSRLSKLKARVTPWRSRNKERGLSDDTVIATASKPCSDQTPATKTSPLLAADGPTSTAVAAPNAPSPVISAPSTSLGRTNMPDLPQEPYLAIAGPPGSPAIPSAIGPVEPTQALPLEKERTELWKQAYEQLRHDKRDLVKEFENILRTASNIPSPDESKGTPEGDQNTMESIARAQQERMRNRQWTWALFGSKTKIRETVDAIFKLVIDSSALISIGMSLAPPYVSIPWSAISALIPLFMNNSAEQQAAMDGLKFITDTLFSYRIAEETFLTDPVLKPIFFEAVLPLYKQILEYQAAVAIYFGKNTLKRLGGDILAGAHWTDALTAVRTSESNSKSAVDFLGSRQSRNAYQQLLRILSEQAAVIENLPLRLSLQQAETSQVMQWSSQIPFYSDHCNVRDRVQPVKEQWLLKDPDYTNWRKSVGGVFYLEGTVGKGKTSLVSGVIEDILQDAHAKVAFFYCSKTSSTRIGETGTTLRNQVVNLFRSVMAQFSLLDDRNSLSSSLLRQFRASYDKIPGGCSMNIEGCIGLIHEVFQEYPEASWTLIIDALDECKDPGDLLEGLRRLKEGFSKLRVLVSSREGILDPFKQLFPSVISVRIEQQNREDINVYIHQEVESRGQRFGLSETQAAELERLLSTRAQGMFRWVVLKLDLILPKGALPRPRLKQDIDSQLKELKESQLDAQGQLTATYREIFEDATGNAQASLQYEVICSALKWSLCAFRSLTARELAYASSMRPDGTITTGITEGFILIYCANFLVESKNVGVQFAHLSVAEFLEKSMPDEFSLPNAHNAVAICCLLFRGPPGSQEVLVGAEVTGSQSQLHDQLVEQAQAPTEDEPLPVESGTSSELYKITNYASLHWAQHCREARQTQDLTALMPRTKTSSIHQTISHQDYVSLFAMIARKFDLNPTDHEGYTALHDAVRMHDERAVRILTSAGARVDVSDVHGCSPLHTASFFGDTKCMDLLIRAGAEKDAQDPLGATPLHYAAYNGHENALRMLIARGAQKNAKDSRGNTPLHFTTLAGLSNLSRILISSGCKLEPPNINNETPLHNAARGGDGQIVRLLLQSGADSDKLNVSGQSPKDVATKAGNLDLVPVFDSLFLGNTDNLPETQTEFPVFAVVSAHLCPYCDLVGWLCGPRRGVKHAHRSSLSDLRLSAKAGCELCLLFTNGLSSLRMDVREGKDDTQIWVEVSLASDQKYSGQGRDLLILTLGTIVQKEFELCVDRDGHEWPLISGRTMQPRSDSMATFSLLREWNNACHDFHDECKPRKIRKQLPTRLVDIGDRERTETISLHLGKDLETRTSEPLSAPESCIAGQDVDYAFLSHRYGPHIIPTMTKKIYEDGNRRVLVSELEKSFQEAIVVMRHFGIRYLWADKLCIDWLARDGSRDDISETAKLAEYATNAALVINAGEHQDVDGFFTHREGARNLLRLQCTFKSDGHESVASSLYFRDPVRIASELFLDELLSRAWIFQEIALPCRVVIYGPDQVYWKCHKQVRSEGSIFSDEPPLDFPHSENVHPGKERSVFDKWYKMVALYSSKNITFFDTKLDAVKGMAKALRDHLSEPSYISGLWEEDLNRGLLWYSQVWAKAERPAGSALPSWSWASLKGSVSFSLSHGLIHGKSKSLPRIGWKSYFDETDSRPVGPIIMDAPYKKLALTEQLEFLQLPFAAEHDRDNEYRSDASFAARMPNKWAKQDGTWQILFDTVHDRNRWMDGAEFTAVMLNKWSPEASETHFRWIGLLLDLDKTWVMSGLHPQSYFRVGLVLGPWSGHDMRDWPRGTFHLSEAGDPMDGQLEA